MASQATICTFGWSSIVRFDSSPALAGGSVFECDLRHTLHPGSVAYLPFAALNSASVLAATCSASCSTTSGSWT